MKEKGFTLIELLAVIVILAIIALIAVPIILNIIEEARKESNERSVELYANAIKNGILTYELREKKALTSGKYNSSNEGKTLTLETDEDEKEKFTVDYEGNVKCTTTEIYTKGYPFYIGLDVDSDNKVTAAYVCFTRNETEYCLKGDDYGEFHTKNKDIIQDAFSDVLDTCSLFSGYTDCRADGWAVYEDSYGYVIASEDLEYGTVQDKTHCDVSYGNFECVEL